MLSCKKVTELVSAMQDRKLTSGERFGMALHLMICRLCRLYKSQIDFLSRAARRLAADPGRNQFNLTESARRRIRDTIDGSKNGLE